MGRCGDGKPDVVRSGVARSDDAQVLERDGAQVPERGGAQVLERDGAQEPEHGGAQVLHGDEQARGEQVPLREEHELVQVRCALEPRLSEKSELTQERHLCYECREHHLLADAAELIHDLVRLWLVQKRKA